MPTIETLLMFLGAAVLLAVVPGPGQLFILGRTLGGGRRVGYASCVGTAIGGLVHVFAGAIGLSALVMASATAFAVVKLVGGAYLIFLGIQEWRTASAPLATVADGKDLPLRAARQAVIVEATNPKTAMFFLALIPQFIELTRGTVAVQFVVLGLVSIALNSAVGLLTASVAAYMREGVTGNGNLLRCIRRLSAGLLVGLGGYVLLARRAS